MVVLRNIWEAVEDVPRLRAQMEAMLLTAEDDELSDKRFARPGLGPYSLP